jgi:BirA family transcriptional regulator, biotin operon repressor / biotin---[acetyl-CoA-carboxylase] ligase
METLFIGKNWLQFDEISSTNDWLMEQISVQKFTEGTVVFALHQTRGKGQRGSSWAAVDAKSLTFSVLLKPSFLSISNAFDLSVCVALAIHDCLNELRPGFHIKWPNDIYFEDQKIAGVLIENQMSKSVYQNAVVGVGLNLNQDEFEDLPKAISLKQIVGVEFPLANVLERLCETLEARYLQLRAKKYESLKGEYISKLYWFNESRFFKIKNELIQATIVDVLRNGRLQVELIDGELRDFDIKEIEFIE